MKYTLTVTILPQEYWWGGNTHEGIVMPFTQESTYQCKLDSRESINQAAPFLVSNHGRYIWSECGFTFSVTDGEIQLEGNKAEIQLYEGFGSLKEAYLSAVSRHFPPSEILPPETFFTVPQYNTWIELTFDQNQKDVLSYAHGIVDNHMPPGILMIDNGWQEYHGCWKFHPGRFPDPKAMIDELHALGFQVMVWLIPLVTADTKVFRRLKDMDCLVRNADGSIAIREWWDGYSAVPDFSNPKTVEWAREQLQELMTEYGVDGFKFDGGDPYFYKDDDRTFSSVDANGQCENWAKFGSAYAYNEFRACFKHAGQPLVQRLGDKNHEWKGSNGLVALVPNSLAQGIMGYSFNCADMIGGGEYIHFWKNREHLDQELFVRYAQCTALMPMMQFSAAPWRVLDAEHFAACCKAIRLHQSYNDIILNLARQAAKTNEPITRLMEYVFPHQGFADVHDQFMLGDDLLVAPVLEKGAVSRTVRFPAGEWLSETGEHITGPALREFPVGLESLPVFRRMKGATQ